MGTSRRLLFFGFIYQESRKTLRTLIPLVLLTASSGCFFISTQILPTPGSMICDYSDTLPEAHTLLRTKDIHLKWAAAHRGRVDSKTTLLENTGKALQRVLESSIPIMETDVRFTTDGTAFLFHDRTLRETNLPKSPQKNIEKFFGRPSSSLSTNELEEIQRADEKRESFATLSELFATEGASHILFLLDVKSNLLAHLDAIVKLARANSLEANIIIQCDSLAQLAHMRAQFPSVAVLARAHKPEEIATLLTYHPEILQGETEFMTAEIIREANLAGSKVLFKVLGKNSDNPDEWLKAFSLGADILLTDEPKQAMAFAREFCASLLLFNENQSKSLSPNDPGEEDS